MIRQFLDDCVTWAKHYGIEKPFEPDGDWIEWQCNSKRLGFNATEFWEHFKEEQAKFDKKYNIKR